MTVSSTPVTVITCATFQLSGVKVTEPRLTVPSRKLALETLIITLLVGALSSTIENCAVPPDSVVVLLIGVTVTPAGGVAVVITALEISDVSKRELNEESVLVAVLVMNSPTGTAAARVAPILALPAPSVLTFRKPK